MLLSLQPTIQAFFAAKRRSEVRIPTIQQLETWDTNRMTAFILSSWADSNTLTLTDLQLKTIALLCLATMARPRSDEGRLQFRDTIFKYQDSSNMTVSGLTLHFRVPKEAQVKTTQLGVLQESRLCPVTTLHIFIQKTATLRINLPVDHTLFLAYIEKPNLVSSIRSSTLSNWVKLLMEKSGVDTNHFKAHSIRAASSTKAVSKGHSIEAVKDHAGWSQDSRTFETFYHKPPNQESSSTAIIHSIFSEAENTITLGDGVEPTEIDLGTTNNLNAFNSCYYTLYHYLLFGEFICDTIDGEAIEYQPKGTTGETSIETLYRLENLSDISISSEEEEVETLAQAMDELNLGRVPLPNMVWTSIKYKTSQVVQFISLMQNTNMKLPQSAKEAKVEYAMGYIFNKEWKANGRTVSPGYKLAYEVKIRGNNVKITEERSQFIEDYIEKSCTCIVKDVRELLCATFEGLPPG
ncbi:hypothetical protein G6F68_010076 [Rhizopus microsporus]|nr:hypothetical protein G6F68_010076 [Rhizopus microsporus]